MEQTNEKESGLPKETLRGEIGTDMICSVKGKPNEEVEMFRQMLEVERETENTVDIFSAEIKEVDWQEVHESRKVEGYSMKNFNKVLCFRCQHEGDKNVL